MATVLLPLAGSVFLLSKFRTGRWLVSKGKAAKDSVSSVFGWNDRTRADIQKDHRAAVEYRWLFRTTVKDGIDYGFVGDVDRANGEMLNTLIQAGITPVIAPLTHDGQGNILNTNADTMASETAKALASYFDVTLIFAFEKAGVLQDPDDDNSVIPVINRDLYNQYVEKGIISGGMMPKIENALAAIEAGVKRVIITLSTAINGNSGTIIQA